MKKPHPTDADIDLNPHRSNQSVPRRAFSKRRLWMFRFMTIVVIPASILGFLELALTLSGYGYPTSFFVKSRIDGQDFLIPSHTFSKRFFPTDLARTPNLTRIPARKAAGVYRIFVFGESAALGDPEPSYGVSRYLDVLLDERYPDTEFEIVCVAMTAINSHAILPIARECAGLEGDLWVIYMGNNEMIGPFGAGTVFGAKAPGLGFVRTGLALKKTRLGQLMASIVSMLASKSQAPDQWGGINMFKENPLRHDDPARLRTYENFAGNLKDILETGRASGVPIILSTVASNLKDCSPFASLHREGLNASEKSEWERLFQEGRAHEQTGQYEQALRSYRDAAEIDFEFAELQFRMGICHLALGRAEQARQAYVHARDYDALAVRADTRINQIVMDATPEDGRVRGLDATEALTVQSPKGIPGKELFYEHVHFNVDGNYMLARIFADQVRTVLPSEILESQTESWLEQDACSRRLGLTVWDQVRLWHAESERVNTMPFTSQTSNRTNREHIVATKKAILARVTNTTAMQDRRIYESALEKAPEDTLLIGNYAQFLDGNGMSDAAIEQAEKFRTLLPNAWTEYYLGALLAKAGRLKEAEMCAKKAVKLRSDFIQAEKLLKQIEQMRR